MHLIPCKMCQMLMDIHLLHFSLLVPLIRWQYSWVLLVLGQVTSFTMPGCRVIFLVAWSSTVQYYPAGRTRGSVFLGVAVGVFMIATWFSMGYFPWRWRVYMLYLCNFGTVGFSFVFQCAMGALVPYHPGWCRVRAGLAFLVLVLVWIICHRVGQPLEVAQ